MAKTKISEYSSTAGNNTDINSINLAEGMAPSLVNNAIRQLMAQLKDFQAGTAGDSLTVGGNLAVTGTSTLTGAITATSGVTGPVVSSSATITGGTINGTPIGGSSPSTVTGTTITAGTGFVGALTGNVTGNVTGNTTGTHTGAVTGNVTGNLTGNVTSSGTSTFTNVTITGTLDMDSGTTGTITGLATPSNSTDAATKAYVDAVDTAKLNLSGGTMSGNIAMGGNKVTGLGTPTSDADAVTKSYVDAIAQGIDAKASCKVATTANITLSGTQTIDGVAVIAADRVLVKNQTTSSENGIYVVAAGSWTRATDADAWTELVSAYTFVEQGTANAANGYLCTVAAGGTLGTTAVTFTQFSGAGQITAGAGLTKTGNQIDVATASSSRIVVNADNIDLATTGVSASTYKSVTVDTYGRVTAGTNPTTISGFGITDAYTKTEVDTTTSGLLAKSGGTMTGNIVMGSNKVTSTATPTTDDDLTRKAYVDSILGSATAAATSAAAAATSASQASTSATNASTSAGQAADSATAAAASYDAFDDRYLGAKSSAPTVDNDGNALITGALYFDTTASEMRVYTGSAWKATGSAVNGTSQRQVYTATSGQTTFSVVYDVGYVDVYLNGVKLVSGTDFTATSGVNVVLTTGAVAGDIVDIVAYGAFNVANTYTQAQADAKFLQVTNNLSDIGSASTARSNLGLVIGTDVQAYDADTAKLDVAQTFTAAQTMTALKETKVAVAASDIDLSAGNYFTKTISGATTFTVSNVASSGSVSAFVLDLTNGGAATVTWWSGITWNAATAPTLTASGVDTLAFFTYDGGTTWRGFVLGQAMA